MITFVEGDDWRGIYIDGSLHYEGHSIPRYVIAELVGADLVYADLNWLSAQGRLPQSLDDVVSE